MSIKSFTKNIPGIGPVLFERSKKAKAVSVTVKPFEMVRVAVPFGMSYQQAEEIVLSRRRTLEAQLAEKVRVEEEHKAGQAQRPEINRTEARAKLVSRLEALSQKYGFTYNRIFVRSQKTKWGSCSGNGNINLNIKLVQLPDHLIDYVILHELVHLRHRNHGPEFWAELNTLVGDAKKIDRELKKYKLEV